ncbi:MAG: low temperature requirement protein A [Geminicoccaceae bacterium]|nr:low temperature requirement protein A [Geminicoccaceae bacterium]
MALKEFPIWRKPRHHMDVDNPSDHVHWVELFFDLVHVVTIFLLGNFLSHHLDLHGFLIFTALFVTIFYAWADSSVYNSLYISTDIPHRMIMSGQIVTVMFMAAALDNATGKGWVYFALAFAANRAFTGLLYWRARTIVEGEAAGLAYEQGRNFFILAIVFAVSAILPKPLAFWVFGAGIAGIQLQYMLPKIGTLRFRRFVPRLGHLSERFGLIMLILLGEGFFKLVVTLSDKGIDKPGAGALFNLVIGGFCLFALGWIYFDSVGNARPRDRKAAVLLGYWFGHMVLMWSTIMVGVALAGEIYVGFMEPYPLDYGWIGCTGLAIFLAAIMVLQSLVAGRDITRRHAHGRVRLFGIAVSLLLLPLLPHVPAIAGNAIFGVALFSQVFWPLMLALRDMRSEDA